MSENPDYTPWLGQEIKKLVDLVTNNAHRDDLQGLQTQITEVQRGIEYGLDNPGVIDELLLKIGRNFVDSLQVYLRQMKPRTPIGIPPGGSPTILTGGTGIESSSNSLSSNSSEQSPQISVEELKGVIASRKKKSVEKNMKGSLDQLKDYD